MSKKSLDKFFVTIANSRTEEDVKHAYARYFDIEYDTSHRHDLYTPQVFFEFKFNKNFHNLKARATILAQTLYYVRKLKFGTWADKVVPLNLCMADQNEAILTETKLWQHFYDDQELYDWDLAPSNPDSTLVDDLASTPAVKNLHIYDVADRTVFDVFAQQLNIRLNPQQLLFGDKKIVSEENFEDVFKYWNDQFGEYVRNGFKTSRYFVADLQWSRSRFFPKENKVMFDIGDDTWKSKKILARDYQHFWDIYDKVEDPTVVRGVLAKIDRLTDEELRRFYGEFFTPVKFAKKALDYIEKTIGKDWWNSGEYRLWDMAAGTGNLEYHLPADALQYCYLSTIYKEDVEHCARLFPSAEVFQYDYLNDDIENLFGAETSLPFEFTWKLPEKLRLDLNDKKIKWIILINPPFATSQKAGTSGGSKRDVSNTKLREVMHKENLGEVSRELFMQFVFRIKNEFSERNAHFGLFSTLKYINANNDQKFRDTVFDFGFEKGFMFSSANFSGTKSNNAFPVSFVLWQLNKNIRLEQQAIVLDIFDEDVVKIGNKVINSENRERFLSKWIHRPDATLIYPPLGSAIEIKSENIDRRDRIAKGFLASLMCKGNDIQNQNFTALLSAPYVSAGALSVVPENFEKSMVVHAVRRIPKATWINDRDQFLQPNTELSVAFIDDCTVWNLFSNSNQTAALRNVEYGGRSYQINNHFFPYLISTIRKWKIDDGQISETMVTGRDTFVASWLKGRNLSAEALCVLMKGREIYQYYFENLSQLPTTKFKIESWDAGWWQIRKALMAVDLAADLFDSLKVIHSELREKILPQISSYEFI